MSELEGVKVGDTLAVPGRGMSHMQFTKVVRLTATRAMCQDGNAYRLKDGHRVGDNSAYFASWARKATQHDLDVIALRNRIVIARNNLQRVIVNEDNVDDIESFLAKLKMKKESASCSNT